ncbi:hypothetical protein [Peristeroidobacter soli]|uniref:hypothetical protein n=1 Tax=Peristeroidobacter soli TaxID=2497877 RepID=UPI00101D63E0|nr:hypothetical protein [Peristeroidobacter soli]
MERNMCVVFQFAFSRTPLEIYCQKNFRGEFANLGVVVFEMAEHRAIQAFLELAVYLRALDDEENVGKHMKEHTDVEFGTLIVASGQTRALTLRDIANKVIHGTGYRWQFSADAAPQFVCDSKEGGMPQNWTRAEIDLGKLLLFCGMLMPGEI